MHKINIELSFLSILMIFYSFFFCSVLISPSHTVLLCLLFYLFAFGASIFSIHWPYFVISVVLSHFPFSINLLQRDVFLFTYNNLHFESICRLSFFFASSSHFSLPLSILICSVNIFSSFFLSIIIIIVNSMFV